MSGVRNGAWGAGPFENDQALDFLAELGELPQNELAARLGTALTLAPNWLHRGSEPLNS
jgi:hypothetical protein